MPTHLPDALHPAQDTHARSPHLTRVATNATGVLDPDWGIAERELNDRIALVVEHGCWTSTVDELDDQVPYHQLKTVDKILAITRTDPILYVTGTIQPGVAGTLVAVTERLLVRAELTSGEGSDSADTFVSQVSVRSRREISNIEVVDVSEARHDVNWPTRIWLNLMLANSQSLLLPLAKTQRVTKEENLAALLPGLLDDLERH
jgi:hypothetical protein